MTGHLLAALGQIVEIVLALVCLRQARTQFPLLCRLLDQCYARGCQDVRPVGRGWQHEGSRSFRLAPPLLLCACLLVGQPASLQASFVGPSALTIDGSLSDWGTTNSPTPGVYVALDAYDPTSGAPSGSGDIQYFWQAISTVSGGTNAASASNPIQSVYYRVDTSATTTANGNGSIGSQNLNIQLNLGSAPRGYADHLLQIWVNSGGAPVDITLYSYNTYPVMKAFTTGGLTARVSNVSGISGNTNVDSAATGFIGTYTNSSGTRYGVEVKIPISWFGANYGGAVKADGTGANTIIGAVFTSGGSEGAVSTVLDELDNTAGGTLISAASSTSGSTVFVTTDISQVQFVTAAKTNTAGSIFGPMTVQTQDGTGAPQNVSTATNITLSSTSSSGRFYSDSGGVTQIPYVTIPAGSSNSPSFYYKDTIAGTPTLTASGANTNWSAGTQVEQVNPAAAHHLAFGTQPGTTTAGTAISPAVTVLVQDQYGNTVTSDSSSVTIASGLTSFTNSTLTMSASSGVATFSAIKPITAGGGKTLTASDGSLTQTNSSTFTINAAAANQLVFTTQPVNTTAGQTLATVVVQLEDAYGNYVAQSGTSITLSGVTLYNGTNPQSTDASGKATFNDLVIRQAVSGLAFTASATGLTGGTSSSFNITAAAASAYRLTDATGGMLTPGVADALTIKLADQYGNTVTSFSGDKNLTFSGLSVADNTTTHPTVTDKNGVAVNLGTAELVTFTSGQATAGGSLVAYKAETQTLSVQDNTNPSLSSSSAGGAGLNVTVANAAPTAGALAFARAPGLSLKISFSDILTNATDANRDAITFTGVGSSASNNGTSAQGATLLVSGSYVYYKPNSAGTSDTFTYNLSDGHGGTGQGTVTVNVVQQGGAAQNLSYSSNGVTVVFAGIPGYTYDVQRSTNPTFSSPTVLETTNAPTAGVFYVTDPSPPNPSGYYRLIQH